MNTQMVSVTDIQRNFKHILDNLVSKSPTVVLRDSTAEAVIMTFEEYKRLLNLEKDILKMQVLADLDYLAEKNKDISFEELDKDIEYSKKHASRNY